MKTTAKTSNPTPEQIRQAIKALVDKNGDYLGIIKAALEAEENLTPQWEKAMADTKDEGTKATLKEIQGFEWKDVPGAHPQHMSTLFRARILRLSYESNRYTNYRFYDTKATAEAIREVEAFMANPEAPEEAPDLPPIEIPGAIFDDIVGYDDLKRHIIRALKADSPIAFLLWGVPGSAKTMFMGCLEQLDGALLIPMTGATKAGLTQELINKRPRILLLDEIDKANREDISVMLTLIENRYVQETKYGRHRRVMMNTWVFLACNDVSRVDQPLLSRVQELYFKPYDKDQFIKTTVAVLTKRFGKDPEIAEYIALQAWHNLGYRDVRKALTMGKIAKSMEDVDEQVKLLQTYKKA